MGVVAGVTISIDGSVVGTTDTSGGINITGLTAGAHIISADKSGYYSATASFSVPEDTSVSLVMQRVSYDITITVTE